MVADPPGNRGQTPQERAASRGPLALLYSLYDPNRICIWILFLLYWVFQSCLICWLKSFSWRSILCSSSIQGLSMATLFSLNRLFLLICFLATSFAGKRDLLITTKSGLVKGKLLPALNGKVRAFLGIPYGKPPVGNLRFRPPQPADPWKGVKDATSYSNSCFQLLDTKFPGRIRRGTTTMCIKHSLHKLNKVKLNWIQASFV